MPVIAIVVAVARKRFNQQQTVHSHDHGFLAGEIVRNHHAACSPRAAHVYVPGSGTEIDYIQVLGSEDDCTEWFGGAVDVQHLVCNGVDDDGLDIDLGYVGNIQFAIVAHGALNGDRGIESDSKDDQLPITAPNLANITLLGNVGKNASIAALHQENFGGKVFRSVFTDNLVAGTAYQDGCVTYENSASLNAGFT